MKNILATVLTLALCGTALAQSSPNIGGAMLPNGAAPSANGTAAVGQLPGTTTNDNAAAGNVGEYVNSTIGSGSAVSLTNGTGANIASISLSAGDWDVWGQIVNQPGGTTVYTLLIADVSTTSGAISGAAGAPGRTDCAFGAGLTGGSPNGCVIAPARFSFNGTVTVFLVANDAFTISTMSGYGYISARRRR
jgi:hypothetical protein